MKKVLVLDNYDSFTYNLVHILKELGLQEVMDVVRNDKIALDDIAKYDCIMLSPGPGLPKDAGIMPALISRYGSSKNILGVCLGHQAIGESFGASLFNLPIVYHGVTTKVRLNDADGLFDQLPETFQVCRYHSWVIANKNFPQELEITAQDEEGRIMAVKHKKHNLRGVQFHPESIMTEHGKKMISNWLSLT
jgi:anthranilate synthase component 2